MKGKEVCSEQRGALNEERRGKAVEKGVERRNAWRAIKGGGERERCWQEKAVVKEAARGRGSTG